MRRLDSIIKKIDFDDKYLCQKETEKVIDEKEFLPVHCDKSPIVQITNKEQLQKYIFPRVEYFHKHKSKPKTKLDKNNIFIDDIDILLSNKKLEVYKGGTTKKSTYNSLDYIFNYFHTTLFVQILNNKIYTFVLLHNFHANSELLKKSIKVDPKKYSDLDDFIKKVNEEHFHNLQLIKQQEDMIYFTDCYMNLWETVPKRKSQYFWFYTYQYNILTNLLKRKKINDTEFMLNYKDVELLLEDGKHNPHYHLLSSFNVPLDKEYKPFLPMYNFCARKKFADIPIPTNDDWEICTNKIFLGNCRDLYFNVNDNIFTDYDSKIPTAIFRGGATGCGTAIKNNPRLKIAYLSKKFLKHPKYGVNNNQDGHLYLDARIVSFKKKVKKHYSNEYIDIIDTKSLKLKLGQKLNFSQLSKYKYIVSIEGNIAGFRLTLELAYNSVILLVKSDFYIWYQKMLKPWVHYVPVKSDLSDLMEKIDWCKKHDDKCKKIAMNAREFYIKYINTNAIYDYMELVLNG